MWAFLELSRVPGPGSSLVAACQLLTAVASLVEPRLQELWASVVAARWAQWLIAHGVSSLQHGESSRTRDQTCVSCTDRQILTDCTTREAQSFS